VKFLLLGALIASQMSFADDTYDAVLAHLSGIEETPTQAELQAIGDGVETALIAIAQDDQQPRSKRGRAIVALGYFPSSDSRVVVEGALQGEDNYMARKACYAIGAGWGTDAVPLLTNALQADNVHTREAAAVVLGTVGGDNARSVLTSRLDTETSEVVREAIQSALAQ